MNKKQKIIVSITGIFLVLLILLGLTYAYFLTQITPNTEEKSISITTADLRIRYEDGTNLIFDENTKFKPSNTEIGTKTFKVINEADDTDYVVLIENVVIKDLSTNSITTFNSNDFRYTLTCTKKDGTSCNGVSSQTALPMSDNILVSNDIAKGDEHSYVMTIWYIETGIDQSEDMNKSLNAKINIESLDRLNPYSNNQNSLAYNIINNALNVSNENANKGFAVYRSTPLTGFNSNSSNPSSEKTLSVAEDEYYESTGIQSYYFRGDVTNNYVDFNGKCWRIVRIEGDGSVKLILEDKDNLCASSDGNWSVGNGNYHQIEQGLGSGHYDYSTLKSSLVTWYNENFTSVDSKIKNDTICLGDYDQNIKNAPFGNSTRIEAFPSSPTLKCDNNMIKATPSKISSLTADEAMLAGMNVYGSASSSYLINNLAFWTITPAGNRNTMMNSGCGPADCVYRVKSIMDTIGVEIATSHYRPVITILSTESIINPNATGEKTNAYKF